MNDRNLLLALVLVAAIAGLWLCFPGIDGFSGGNVADSGVQDGDVVGETNDVASFSGSEEMVGEYSKDFRKSERGEEERLAAGAEVEAVKSRLREMQRRDDKGLVVETMPDGHQSIHLQGRFQHVTRLVRAQDGSMVPVCGGYFQDGEKEEVDE